MFSTSHKDLKVMEVVGTPSIGKQVTSFTCVADGKEYFTTNFSQLLKYADNSTSVPSRDQMYRVGVDAQSVVRQDMGRCSVLDQPDVSISMKRRG